MGITDTLYLDTPATPEEVEAALVDDLGLQRRDDKNWQEKGYAPWLSTQERGLVLVERPNEETRGPFDHPQPKTVIVWLNRNKDLGASEYLMRLAGDLLQRFPGDATLVGEGGDTVLVRRGEAVWVKPEPFNLRCLFAGAFRPTKLVHGLPPPAPPRPDPYTDEDGGQDGAVAQDGR